MPDSVRCFVAVHMPPEVKNVVRAARDDLRARLGDVPIKWVRDDNIHLTLAFLGAVSAARLEDLTVCLNSSARLAPFNLRVGAVGAFPNSRSAKVLWVGLTGDISALEALQRLVSSSCASFGSHAQENRFHAHITVARCNAAKSTERQLLATAIACALCSPISWTVESFELMRSTLRPDGPIYEPLKSFKLIV